MDAYLRGLFARMRFLPPPTTDLREAFGMKALAGKTPEGLTSRPPPTRSGRRWWLVASL